MLILAGAGAYATVTGGELAAVSGSLAGAAWLVFAAGVILRWPFLLPWAIALTGVAYLIGRHGESSVDGWAAVVGAGLLAAAELGLWSISHDARIRTEPGLAFRRAATLVALVAGSLLLNFLLLGTAALAAPSGVVLAAIGVAAAVSSIAVVLRLLRRQ